MPQPTAINIQDKITLTFSKTGVEVTHPTGVKVTHAKADVQAILDALQAESDAALAAKGQLQADIVDKINAAPEPVAELASPGTGR